MTAFQIAQQQLIVLQQIRDALSGSNGPQTPDHFAAKVTAMPKLRKVRLRDAGPGMVSVVFSWDAASDGGVTDSYQLTVLNSDGSVFQMVALGGTETSHMEVMPDDPNLHSATLTAFNKNGDACPIPAGVQFTPHIATPPPPPPPPQLPGNPTGLTATVGP